MLQKTLCYLLLCLIIPASSLESSEFKLEIDKDQSIISGSTNISSLYLGLSNLQDSLDDTRFKIFNSCVF